VKVAVVLIHPPADGEVVGYPFPPELLRV